VQHDDNHFRQLISIEKHQHRVARELIADAPFGIRGDFQQKQIVLRRALEPHFQQAVRQLARLNNFALDRAPALNIGDVRQTQNRVAVLLKEPLAAAVIRMRLHRYRAPIANTSGPTCWVTTPPIRV
jgi:hypothetical protein